MIHIGAITDMARLAHLHLEPHEMTSLDKDLSQVFHWVSELETLCLQAIQEKPLPLSVLRADTMPKADSRGDILYNAPSTARCFFTVPKVLGL